MKHCRVSRARAMSVIWYNDFGSFVKDYYHIIPNGNMTIEEKLNAVVRFFTYLGVALALIQADSRFLFFGIVSALLSVVLYRHETREKEKAERFLEEKQLDIVNNKICSRSTVDNPFMNPSVVDITDNPHHPQACSITDSRMKTAVEDNFNARLFRDSGDMYDTMSSNRQFYTMPVTTIPNDQTAFAKWLYLAPKTCKEGSATVNTDCRGFQRVQT